jgi:hypothetical protein
MMNGEALLGRLPDNINLVKRMVPVGSYLAAFRD